jgi:P4 family phage/plasmid primase-like protien
MTVEHEGAGFIRAIFGPSTSHDVFLTSLGNDRDGGEAPRQVVTRDMKDIARFCQKWDRPGRGLFYCVGTLKPGTTRRAKENISEIVGLHSDVDLKSINIGLDEALERIDRLRLLPSFVVSSGGGLHAYWLFRESIPATSENMEKVEAALHLLSDLVGGDVAVCEISRLMRVPGTHNTKAGAWNEVKVVRDNAAARYELDEIEEWLAEASPVIDRKDAVRAPSGALVADNPFLAVAAKFGFKPPIDVQQRLGAMSYQGSGDTSIHQTQLQVSASLLSRGTPVDEVVGILCDATRAAAGPFAARWNWRREDHAIRRMCEDWQRKNPAVRTAASVGAPVKGPPRDLEDVKRIEAAVNGGSVVHLTDARAKRAPKKVAIGPDKQAVPSIVADGTIEAIRRAGQDILLTEGEVYIYAEGIWHIMTPADQQWVLTLIQEGFEALGEPAKNAGLTAAWKRMIEHPGLYRRKVKWAAGEFIVATNGVLDIKSRTFSPHAASHFARRKIGAAYRTDEHCPKFLTFLGSLFADRGADSGGFVSVIQSFMGACLAISFLSREERKALILVGPSRSGKTELARVARLLIGDPIATPSVAEISERFGLSSLYDAAAWIRDDAINEGDDLDPQRFKTIVTGEPIDIERKHRPAMPGVELTLPVLLTANALPKARDKSDAIFNRSIVLEMTNVWSEDDAKTMRARLGVPRGQTLAAHIFAEEGPGILNWALAGLDRLMERGSYDLPETVRSSIQRFKDDNNPVGEWAREAIIKSPRSKVSRGDIMCAYHGWQREQDGDEARAFGARAFFPRLRAITPGTGEAQEHNGRRYITGVALSDAGLQFWELHSQGPQLKGGSKGTSLSKSEVNKTFAEEPKSAPEDTKIQPEKRANEPRF